jgi:hypothetical protein
MKWAEGAVYFQPFLIPSAEISLHLKGHLRTPDMKRTKSAGTSPKDLESCADGCIPGTNLVAKPAPVLIDRRRHTAVW